MHVFEHVYINHTWFYIAKNTYNAQSYEITVVYCCNLWANIWWILSTALCLRKELSSIVKYMKVMPKTFFHTPFSSSIFSAMLCFTLITNYKIRFHYSIFSQLITASIFTILKLDFYFRIFLTFMGFVAYLEEPDPFSEVLRKRCGHSEWRSQLKYHENNKINSNFKAMTTTLSHW